MRTTLVLDDKLLVEAKKRAADRRTTVSEVVNDALRESFAAPVEPVRPFRLITYGDPSKPMRLSVEDIKQILDDDDMERYR